MPVLKMLYKNNSGKNSKPGTIPFVSIQEFTDLIINTGACNDYFGSREIGIHFNLSKVTEIDELDFTKHLEMKFGEFLEAISRIAEKIPFQTLQALVNLDC